MVFVYKIDNVKNYCRDNCIKSSVPLLIGLLFFLFSFYILLDFEQKLFVILLTSTASLFSMILYILFIYLNLKNEYLSFNLIIENDIITIKSKSLVKSYNMNQIKNIYRDKNGNYYIKYSHFNKTKILGYYIENIAELENILLNIKPIEKYTDYPEIVHHLPYYFFIGLILVNKLKNIYLYIIFAFCIIISSILSSILTILEGDKKKMIGILFTNIVLIAIFTIILIYTMNYLKG